MRILASLTLILCACATMAQAGPWARDRGNVFLSYTISSTTSRDMLLLTGEIEPDTTHSFYGELGLGHRLTFGASTSLSDQSQFTMAFLRRTLTRPETPWQFAVAAGGAVQEQDGEPDRPLARVGLSLGRGFGAGGDHWAVPIRHRGGWAVLDTTAYLDVETTEFIWQVEGTFGLALTNRLTSMVGLLAEDWDGGDVIVTARPSLLFDVTERTSLRLGGHVAVDGDDGVGAVLGLWHEF